MGLKSNGPRFLMNPTPYKVLLVDDSPPMLEALQYLLHDERDLAVIGVAETGQQALNLIIQHTPDIVLLDIHLTDLEGYDVTRLAKKLKNPPLIILISANGDPQTRQKGLEAGSDGFIEKGADWPKILQQIRQILSKNISETQP
ncbi:MAG TPA: response regulator transcription factor [Anaerolineales bacterium]|nr:response regulator transcription factor [Anaerolineales bacterium]